MARNPPRLFLFLSLSSRLFCLIERVPEGPRKSAGRWQIAGCPLWENLCHRGIAALPWTLFSQSLEVAPKAVKLVQVEGGPLALAKVPISLVRSNRTELDSHGRDERSQRPVDPIGRRQRRDTNSVDRWSRRLARRNQKAREVSCQHPDSIGRREGDPSVEWEVQPAIPPPAFSYLAGPAGCNNAPGDARPPLCTPLPLPGIVGPPPAGAELCRSEFWRPRPRDDRCARLPHLLHSLPAQRSPEVFDELSRKRHVGDRGCRHSPHPVPTNPCNQRLLGCDGRRSILLLSGRRSFQHDLRTDKSSVLIDYSSNPSNFTKSYAAGPAIPPRTTGSLSGPPTIRQSAPWRSPSQDILRRLRGFPTQPRLRRRRFHPDLQRHRQDQPKALRHADRTARDGNIFCRFGRRRPEPGISRPGEPTNPATTAASAIPASAAWSVPTWIPSKTRPAFSTR